MFYCLDVHLYDIQDKSRFVCAHIGQNRHIYPPSIFRLHFDSYPLPLFRRFIVGAAIEKNFFWFLFFWFSLVFTECLDWNYFFDFQTLISTRILFFLFFSILVWIVVSTLFFRLSYLIISTRLKFVILYSILFFRNIHRLDSLQVLLDIYSFAILVFASEFLLASISTCFSIVDSMLRLFISLTLLLVINKHLCLFEFVLCLFGYFKAFWRVFVCFRCSLSSLVEIMRQKA